MKLTPLILKTFIIVCSLLSSFSYAQLQVTTGGSPSQIINALVGSNMTVTNVTINCGATGYGIFNGSSSNIGLSNGILLTTGDASLAIGPNNTAGAGYCWNFSPGSPDPQLITIEPNAVYDLCVLEFDVVPHCSSINMQVVFASEEYPEYVSSNVNDAFGFFVTGPSADCSNPLGYNQQNVALLPNGSPISIDNINEGNWACPGPPTGCTNCAYYVDNCAGLTVQYDGFTTPVNITLNVCPCATYHWKIAIADAGDCVWDSGVFFQFINSCAGISANVTQTNTCSCNGTAAVSASGGAPPYTYNWSTGDTAQTITGLCPGNYSVSVTDTSGCNLPFTQNFTILNTSNLALSTSASDASCSSCSDGSILIAASGGSPVYSYSVYPAVGTFSGDTILNVSPGSYYVCVQDADSCITCDSAFVDYTTSVQSLNEKHSVFFYPNPFADKSVLYLNGFLNESATLLIADTYGRVVKQMEIRSAEIAINRTDMPAEGIYFYKLVAGGSVVAKGKLMVADR